MHLTVYKWGRGLGSLQRLGHIKNTPWTTDGVRTSSATTAAVTALIRRSLLSALFVVVVVFGAAARRGSLGAAVLLGLLQELVEPEGILLKLNGPLPPLPVVGTQEVFVWDEPNRTGKKRE